MQGVVELDPCHGLPEDLNQLNAAESAVPLWDKDEGLTGALIRKVTLRESRMDQATNHIPLKGFRQLLPGSGLYPDSDMFHLHSGRAIVHVQA